MKFFLILSVLCLLSVNSYAEKCEGINACTLLYTKLNGEAITVDTDISDEMTLAVPGTDLTKENAHAEFLMYLSKNAVSFLEKNKRIFPNRRGEFLTSPIYIVSENNMPQMINKDGAVTLVYHAKNAKKAVDKAERNLKASLISKKGKIVEYHNSQVVTVIDTFENATKTMTLIMKADK